MIMITYRVQFTIGFNIINIQIPEKILKKKKDSKIKFAFADFKLWENIISGL